MRMFWKIISDQYQPNDRKPLKYWLPYGYMVRKVYRTYRYTTWNGVPLDVPGVRRPPFQRFFRSIMPYGLILGLDQKALGVSDFRHSRPHGECCVRPVDEAYVKSELQNFSRRLGDLERRMSELEDGIVTRLEMIENILRRKGIDK